MCIRDRNATGWYIGRMAGFVGLNVGIGWIIYALFKRAGVIGAPPVMDAELVKES